MKLPRPRFTIGRLMILVAVIGVLIALLRTAEACAFAFGAVLIFGPLAIAFLYPFYPLPGRRLLAATWVAALGPLTIPWTIHVAWSVAHGFLGHSPGLRGNGNVINYSFLGHSPWIGSNGNVIIFLANSVAIVILLALFSSLFCLVLQLFFVSGGSIEFRVSPFARAIPIFILLFSWYFVVIISKIDPFGAIKWCLY